MRGLSLLFAAVLLAGCVPSLHPIYTPRDVVFEKALLGTWQFDDDQTWTFQRHESDRYLLTYTDEDGRVGTFVATLAKIDGHLFLDLLPQRDGDKRPDFHDIHFVAAHTFVAVERIEPDLRVTMLKPDWLVDVLEEDPDALRHEVVDDRIVITASTPELQKFFTKHRSTPGAFGEWETLVRRQESGARGSSGS